MQKTINFNWIFENSKLIVVFTVIVGRLRYALYDGLPEYANLSTTNERVHFSSIRPVATFAGPVITASGTGYSRESTPDSGGSHYMEAYREAPGKHAVENYAVFFNKNFGIGQHI